MQGRQALIGSKSGQTRVLFYLSTDRSILVSGAVIVTECNERSQFKAQVLDPLWMIVLLQFVVHHGAVFTVDHEHCFLDLDALDFVGEDGKWIEAKLLEVSKPLRVDDTRIAIRGKIKRLVLDEECLFQLRKHDNTANRRLSGGHQQSVITAGVQPDDCRRSKAADSVGFKPLPAECGVWVAACFFCELNHELPSLFGETQSTPESDERQGTPWCGPVKSSQLTGPGLTPPRKKP